MQTGRLRRNWIASEAKLVLQHTNCLAHQNLTVESIDCHILCVCVMIWFHAQRSRWLVFRRERSSDVRVTARRRDLHNFRQAVKQEMTWPRNMKQSTSGTSKSHHGSSWNLNSITLHSSTELARSTWLRCLSNSS